MLDLEPGSGDRRRREATAGAPPGKTLRVKLSRELASLAFKLMSEKLWGGRGGGIPGEAGARMSVLSGIHTSAPPPVALRAWA